MKVFHFLNIKKKPSLANRPPKMNELQAMSMCISHSNRVQIGTSAGSGSRPTFSLCYFLSSPFLLMPCYFNDVFSHTACLYSTNECHISYTTIWLVLEKMSMDMYT